MPPRQNNLRQRAVPPGIGRSLITTASILASLSLLSVAFAVVRFDIAAVPGPGNRLTFPGEISDTKRIVGTFATTQAAPGGGNIDHAFVRVNGVSTEIPTLAGGGVPGANTEAFGHGINDSGAAVGASRTGPGGPLHAFSFKNGVVTDLNPKFGGTSSQAMGINNDGVIVGTFNDTGDARRAFVIRTNGAVIDLGPGIANAISNTGFVVGETLDNEDNTVPFVFRDANNSGTVEVGEMVLLGTLGNANNNSAADVNDSGKVVGVCADPAGLTHPVIWNSILEGAAPQKLGTLGGAGAATGINNAGQVVGFSKATAFLWENGQIINLQTLLPKEPGSETPKWQLVYAGGINNSGEIVGNGLPNTPPVEAGFLLTAATTPPPPPGTIQLQSLTINPTQITLRSTPVVVTGTVSLTARPKKTVQVRLVLRKDGVVIPTGKPLVVKLKKKQAGSLGIFFAPTQTPGNYEITATFGGITKTATLLVKPREPISISAFTVAPNVTRPGGKVVGTITLSEPPPAPVNIPLKFFKDGQQIPIGKTIEIPFKKKKGKLKNVASKEFTIPGAVPAGTYEVEATYTNSTKRVTLKVQ